MLRCIAFKGEKKNQKIKKIEKTITEKTEL
jgi:hypothetical protein